MNKQLLIAAMCIGISYTAHAQTSKATVSLPAPYATKSVSNFSKSLGWDKGNIPIAPNGFKVTKYAEGFQNPRWMYVTPNGDVLVSEANMNSSVLKKVGAAVIGADNSHDMKNSADRITLLRDADKDGVPEVKEVFLEGLNQPFGMLIIGQWLYVANTNALMRYPYKTGITNIKASGEKIIDLPAGKHNQHWTRNIVTNAAQNKIYIAIGSGSNVAEHGIDEELLKADILEIDLDGSNQKVYASGLRNPVGMDWAPGTNTLWTAVNERDELGDDLVPDYLTSVQEGGFYGWPYAYWGQNEDPRVKEKKPDMVKKTIVPDVDLGAHTASLGLVFNRYKLFPAKYQGGAFIAQHGSWNRSTLSGYKVVYVPFKNGKPSGMPQDFLTGFIANLDKDEVYGRPTGVTFLTDGSLLVTDDVNNIIWRVSAAK